ncbi:hypothetical protein ACH5RR_001115 [Cinchona calisaya]|uniref:Reverse transcriptase domain-containing protein n=1 Tax=Cinchona calisaya TaxID=153742 RepID=A0ABD3B2L7_9GENT
MVLSRGLKKQFEESKMDYYHTSRNAFPINHLTYADDIIIFTNGGKKTVNHLMKFIHSCELDSGCFYQPKRMLSKARMITRITGSSKKEFPSFCLGFPLKNGRKNRVMFQPLVDQFTSTIVE